MIEWKQVKKEIEKLKLIPDHCFNPCDHFLDSASWFVFLSERALGKTTGALICAMVANKLFNTVAEYVRLTADMIKPKKLSTLFEVIESNNYIEKITEGRWNGVYYFGNVWKYCNRDEEGKIIEKCQFPLMHVFDLNETNKLKSSYNNVNGDLIIVDEFIDNQTPYQDYFFYLCDSASTVFRSREGCKIVLLANTIDVRSVWFSELGIMRDVNNMKIGERKLIKPKDTTTVYVEIVANTKRTVKQKINDLYFGFKNPKLNAITGDDTWAYSSFPIWEKGYFDEDNNYHAYVYEFLNTNIFLLSDGFYNQVIIAEHEKYGICAYIRPWNIIPRDEDIILVNGTPTKHNEFNFKQNKRLFKILFANLYKNQKWYYKNNISGISVKSFMENAK